MTTIPHGHGIKIFNNQTVAAGGTAESGWHGLDTVSFNNHAINGKFAGTGTLKIEYKLASVEDDTYGDYEFTPLSSATAAANSPFIIAIPLVPAYYIKFKLTETGSANDITGLHLYFVQAGG
jgi:hypothetical protein